MLENLKDKQSQSHCRKQAKRRKVSSNKPWTDWEIEYLITAWKKGIYIKIIEYNIGRSKSSIQHKRKELGLPKRRDDYSVRAKISLDEQLAEDIRKRSPTGRLQSAYMRKLLRLGLIWERNYERKQGVMK